VKRIEDPGADFVPACEKKLGFLERELGFRRHIVDGTAVQFEGDRTAVRIELAPRDDEICVWLVRLVAGQMPPVFAYAPSHWIPLDELEPGLRYRRRFWGDRFSHEELDRTLAMAASALHRNEDVLRGDHEIFERHAR
jgi:hypothetical protein